MLPIPSNALERSSAQALGLITGYFPWIMSSGIDHQDKDSFEEVHNIYQFIDIVNADCFSVNWRKSLICVSNLCFLRGEADDWLMVIGAED
jgi:hypothetical protein